MFQLFKRLKIIYLLNETFSILLSETTSNFGNFTNLNKFWHLAKFGKVYFGYNLNSLYVIYRG